MWNFTLKKYFIFLHTLYVEQNSKDSNNISEIYCNISKLWNHIIIPARLQL